MLPGLRWRNDARDVSSSFHARHLVHSLACASCWSYWSERITYHPRETSENDAKSWNDILSVGTMDTIKSCVNVSL
jgi:hypothetical protein